MKKLSEKDKARIFASQQFISNKKTGKFHYKSELPSEDLASKLLEAEQYLNNEVATEMYKKYGIAFRFHL